MMQELPPPDWNGTEEWSMKYVDDLTVDEHHFSTDREKREIHAAGCEEIFEAVRRNASRIGMQVNNAKTQLICLSSNSAIDVQSSIVVDNETIKSQTSMKILGFVLNTRADMSEHVSHVTRKIGMRNWMITHLKPAGVTEEDLFAIYATAMRPIIEYACPLYNSMLTVDLSQKLERLQRRTLRTITGPGISYSTALERSNLHSLQDRREEICRKFTLKTVENPRYKERN